MDQSATNLRWSGSGVPAEYRPLHKYSETRFADAVFLTFGQIEDLLGLALPNGAYAERSWWDGPDGSGTPTPQATAWVRASRIATVNLTARTVIFDRARD